MLVFTFGRNMNSCHTRYSVINNMSLMTIMMTSLENTFNKLSLAVLPNITLNTAQCTITQCCVRDPANQDTLDYETLSVYITIIIYTSEMRTLFNQDTWTCPCDREVPIVYSLYYYTLSYEHITRVIL